MFHDRKHLLPTNCTLVDEYLSDPAFDDLNSFLLPVHTFGSTLDDTFRKKVQDYANDEESRIESNLHLMAYEIDSSSTLMLITGPGRIERVSQYSPETYQANAYLGHSIYFLYFFLF